MKNGLELLGWPLVPLTFQGKLSRVNFPVWWGASPNDIECTMHLQVIGLSPPNYQQLTYETRLKFTKTGQPHTIAKN